MGQKSREEIKAVLVSSLVTRMLSDHPFISGELVQDSESWLGISNFQNFLHISVPLAF